MANDNQRMNDTDSSIISMILLEQLPIFIRKNLSNHCILTPGLISRDLNDINENIVTITLKDPVAKQLWNRLFQHWVIEFKLLRFH
jgi:hypothetical protein